MPHILIVEDETIIRSALRRLLERNQYQVSEAGSVQEAQERFSIPSFDLIVSDLRLPGAPGTELIKLGQGKPVLIMPITVPMSCLNPVVVCLANCCKRGNSGF